MKDFTKTHLKETENYQCCYQGEKDQIGIKKIGISNMEICEN